MHHPLVVHCKVSKYDVYCGRPSQFGNPFITGVDGTREVVIEKHKKWFLHNHELIEIVKRELKGKILGCWCAPKTCHCDILAEIANRDDNV